MSTVLITGASGFIGRALASAMAANHNVLCMSRKNPELDLPWVQGDFGSFEDLRKLDGHTIDVVIHLSAVTGGCTEREGILVNVEGSRCLMRYLMDTGCQKFVFASSIAAVGFQNKAFRPLQLPMPDEHPCLDRDGYGFSKFMMEEVSKYYQRQNESIDVINLRLSSVGRDDKMPDLKKPAPLTAWALGGISYMVRSDAIRVFATAAEATYKPGVRTLNATAPRAWAAVPVAELLENWWGSEVDLSHFKQPGHEYDAVYDVSRIASELSFVAEKTESRH